MQKKTNVKKNLRRIILNLHQYTAGRSIQDIAVKYKLDPKKILKLGSNENLLGSSPKALKAAHKALSKVNIYPQVASDDLANRLTKIYKLKNVNVFAGNGMDHIFEMLARLFLNNGDETIICPPTFSCYELATLWSGAKPVFVPLLKPDYQLDVKNILKKINKRTKIIFICSPNNPTGNSMKLRDIKTILEATDKIVFLDEAYTEFGYRPLAKWVDKYPNLIVGRTFSKIYGLAGLRIGFAFMHKSLGVYYKNSITPFVVSTVAQAAAISALDDKKFISKTRRVVNNGKKFYYKELKKAGIKYLPSNANFIAINTHPLTGKYVSDKLLQRGIITRECSAFGQGGKHLTRITIGTREQNKRVIKELLDILK